MTSRTFLVASLLSCCAAAGIGLASAPDTRFMPHELRSSVGLLPCEVPGVESGGRCGTHDVDEDRHARTGRTISLNIVVIPALSATPAPDPVFWLEGGPGGAATQAVGPVSQKYLQGLPNDRDRSARHGQIQPTEV